MNYLWTVIRKDDNETLNSIHNAIETAKLLGLEKWGNRVTDPSSVRIPIIDDDNSDKLEVVYRNSYYMTTSSDYKPGVINEQKLPLCCDDHVFENSYGRVSFYFEPYIYNKGIGVKCCLLHVQVLNERLSISDLISSPEDGFDD